MEHMVLSSINKYVENLNIINEKRHGFPVWPLLHYSANLINDGVQNLIESKEQMCVKQIHFSKAFDRLPHTNLLEKLPRIRDITVQTIKSKFTILRNAARKETFFQYNDFYKSISYHIFYKYCIMNETK